MTIDMTLEMERDEHLGEDELERYSIGNVGERDVPLLEEHVLICETCQDRLAGSDSWVRSIRRAAAKWPLSARSTWIPWSFPRLVPVLAAVILIVAATVALRFSRQSAVTPLAVVLEATRGPAAAAQVPALQALLLKPGLEGLPPLDRYHLEVVDRFGKNVWQANFAPLPGSTGGVFMPGISRGAYFVRLYDPSGTLLREYAVEARGASN